MNAIDLTTIVPFAAYDKLEQLRATPDVPQEDVDRYWYSLSPKTQELLNARAFLEAQYNGRAPYLDPNVRTYFALDASPTTSEEERAAWDGFPGEREFLQVAAHVVYIAETREKAKQPRGRHHRR